MDPKEQLDLWCKGSPVHDDERRECCPDFSCCQHEYAATQEEREEFRDAYHAGDGERVNEMLAGFLYESCRANGLKVVAAIVPSVVPKEAHWGASREVADDT